MVNSDKISIRHGNASDSELLSKLESICFPPEESASYSAIVDRLNTYPQHFWLLELNGKIIAQINGMVTDEKNLRDEMYSNVNLHNENGKWQMLFAVETLPEYQNKGYASMLMQQVISDSVKDSKAGIVLTCKSELIPYYERFGFVSEGVSESVHGGAVWYQMRLVL